MNIQYICEYTSLCIQIYMHMYVYMIILFIYYVSLLCIVYVCRQTTILLQLVLLITESSNYRHFFWAAVSLPIIIFSIFISGF